VLRLAIDNSVAVVANRYYREERERAEREREGKGKSVEDKKREAVSWMQELSPEQRERVRNKYGARR
jgi:hypothetical protein